MKVFGKVENIYSCFTEKTRQKNAIQKSAEENIPLRFFYSLKQREAEHPGCPVQRGPSPAISA
jgi:hypothetical protein